MKSFLASLALSAVAIMSSSTVDATGPQAIFSKMSYEHAYWGGNNWVLQNFYYQFDQPLYLTTRDDVPQQLKVITDQSWYYKTALNPNTGVNETNVPRVYCTSYPYSLFIPYEGNYFNPQDTQLDLNSFVPDCAPFITRSFDGAFAIWDPLDTSANFLGIGSNLWGVWPDSGNNQIRYPDGQSAFMRPAVLPNNTLGYNDSQFAYDLMNYNRNLPLNLLDPTTLVLTEVVWSDYEGNLNYYGQVDDQFSNYEFQLMHPATELVAYTDVASISAGGYESADGIWTGGVYQLGVAYARTSLSNANDEAVETDIPVGINYIYSECLPDDLAQLNATFYQIQQQMISASNLNQLNTLQLSLYTLQTQYPFDACFQFIKSLYSTVNEQYTSLPTTNCLSQVGTFQYATDPCCNATLAFSQCCSPKTTTTTITVAQQLINATQCANPSYALSAISSLVSTLNQPTQVSISSSNLATSTYQQMIAFEGVCYKKIYNRTCNLDGDCAVLGSSSVCQTIGICTVPYTNYTSLMLSCYLANMESDFKARVVNTIGANPANSTDIMNKFTAAVTSLDCVGPTASKYRTQYLLGSEGKPVIDSNGNPIVIPANSTACLADQQCDYNNIPAGQSCSGNALSGSNFCGLCSGGQCTDITRNAQCIVTYIKDPVTCANNGLFWNNIDVSQSVGARILGISGVCVNTSITSSSACLVSNICPPSLIPNDNLFRCMMPLCYAPKLNSASLCAGIKNPIYTWNPLLNNDKGLCVSPYDPNNGVNCSVADGFLPFTGRIYIPGKFDTPAACAQGQCSIKNPNFQYTYETETHNQAACSKLTHCSQSCPRCRSSYAIDAFAAKEVLCFDSMKITITNTSSKATVHGKTVTTYTITDNSAALTQQCFQKGGWFQKLPTTGKAICRYFQDQPTCLANKHSINTCSQYSRNTCYSSGSDLDNLLMCRWDSTAVCLTDSACLATGSCSDSEFINIAGGLGKNGYYATGACLIPAPIVNGAPTACTNMKGIATNTTSYNLINSQMIAICLDNVVSQTACQAAGYTWQDKALTQSQCLSHGSNCFEEDGYFTNKNAAQCSNCGGTTVNAYTWTFGKYNAGFVRNNTQWFPRKTVSVNQFTSTINQVKLDELFRSIAIRSVAIQSISSASLQLSQILTTMSQLACDCSPIGYSGGNSQTVGFYQGIAYGQGIPDPNVCYSSNQMINQAYGDLFASSAINLVTSNADIYIDQSGILNVPTQTVAVSTSLYSQFTSFNAAGFVSINNPSTNAVLGYIVGSGISINATVPVQSQTVSFNLIANLYNAIQANDSTATFAGIAQLSSNGVLTVLPVQASFINGGGAISTSGIYQAGSYFPALLNAAGEATIPSTGFQVQSKNVVVGIQKSGDKKLQTSAVIVIVSIMSALVMLL